MQTFFHVYVICLFVVLFAVAYPSHRCSSNAPTRNNTYQNLLAMAQTFSYCEHYGTLTVIALDIDCMIDIELRTASSTIMRFKTNNFWATALPFEIFLTLIHFLSFSTRFPTSSFLRHFDRLAGRRVGESEWNGNSTNL